VGWVQDKLGEVFWSKQRDIAESVVANRFTGVKSCHGAGKSHSVSRLAAWWIDCHPPGSAFVLTTAPSFPQVRAILWGHIGETHSKAQLIGRVNQTEWLIGKKLVGMGRKPQDYDQTAFQGIHARYVLVIVDEASGIPKSLWDAIDSIVTNDDSRVVAIGNPDDPTSQFAENCKPGSEYKVIRISAFDTPNFTKEAKELPEDILQELTSRTWVEERKKKWGEDSALYIAKVLGEFPDAGTDNLIPLSWVERARERDPADVPRRKRQPTELGVDVARFGEDESVIALRTGVVARILDRWRKADTMATAGRVRKALRETGATAAKIDVVLLGAGVQDRLVELGEPAAGLNGGAPAIDSERFANARTEWFWGLRERFEAGDIVLDPSDEEAAGQLASLKYKFTSRGQIQVETKKEARARGIPSPDHADAVMLAFATPPPTDLVVEDKEQEDYRISPL
jgi:hypothetical protein